MNEGLAFHLYHDALYGWCYSVEKRREHIRDYKPRGEIALRLRVLQIIPADRIPGRESPEFLAYKQAWLASEQASQAYKRASLTSDQTQQACEQAKASLDFTQSEQAYKEARLAYKRAWQASDQAGQASDQAWQEYEQAKLPYEQAWKAYDLVYGAEILKLHAELCPDCPWDGKTIFPEGGDK